jgi:hypothetical protein
VTKETDMATRILFAPKQADAVMDIARSLTPQGFELVVAEPGTPEFYEAAGTAEFYLGLARQIGGEFFRSAPKLRLVQLISAGYDHVDVESARKAKVPVANNGGANAIAVAEHTIMLMLAVQKRLVRFHNDVVAGKWNTTMVRAHQRFTMTSPPRRDGLGDPEFLSNPDDIGILESVLVGLEDLRVQAPVAVVLLGDLPEGLALLYLVPLRRVPGVLLFVDHWRPLPVTYGQRTPTVVPVAPATISPWCGGIV